ncbi:MAG: 1,4-alpha-glucan branching protein GlgB, partial [Deltaproteobacteria bacterium]
WLRGENNRWLTYREIAPRLAEYVNNMGFTHVELMPVAEHFYYPSWGYQVSNFYAPTSRYGTPQDFMYLVDYLHQQGIGVLADWVPAHFPKDEAGLSNFDGTHLYSYSDWRERELWQWGTNMFNWGRHEVRSFLIANALFWLENYHIDGIRVDAVSFMTYRDASRAQWVPNIHGGKENLEAVAFLKDFNIAAHGQYPGILTIAEESTSWSMVSRPTYMSGLGFSMKWAMGWMNNTLKYMHHDPLDRKYYQWLITKYPEYAFSENFMLPLSHDEVAQGKGSLLEKMRGDRWQQFANLRLLIGNMFAMPGKKLLFMGSEFGQSEEWNLNRSLDWHLLQYPEHAGVQRFVRDWNHLYLNEPILHEMDFDPSGFEWIDAADTQHSVISVLRKGKDQTESVLVVFNFTPVPRFNYRIGVPEGGYWREILNSDSEIYSGGNVGNPGGVMAQHVPVHGRPYSLNLTLPPLGMLI